MKLAHLAWSPVKEGETWALTLVRVTGNLLRWIVGVPVILASFTAIGIATYNWHSSQPIELNTMQGVAIGMSPDEVTIAKGEPDQRSDPRQNEEGAYRASMTFDRLYVFFEGPLASSLFVRRICDTQPSTYQSYNGVSSYDSEADVLKQLGEPDTEKVHEDKLGKAMFFNRWNTIVHVKADSVAGVCIGVD